MATIKLSPSGKEVACQSDDTVLAALERQGYALPNNCRAGACGECKTKVLHGEVNQGIVLDMALSQAERDDGYRLMCMAKPESDELTIDFGTDDARPKLFPPQDRIRCVVTDTIGRTANIREVRLRPVGSVIRYWPGQYLMVGDERTGIPARPYSIANAPRSDGEISLLVGRVPDGQTSGWIHDSLSAGDSVTVAGPYGTFIGDQGTESPVLCLASGSGLAPIFALTDAALRRGFDRPVTILYSARSADDVFDQGLVSWWTAKHRRFNFLTTFTGEPPPNAKLTGRVPAVLPELMPDLSEYGVYIAGNPDFVDACRVAALSLGALEERLHVEAYHPQSAAETPSDLIGTS